MKSSLLRCLAALLPLLSAAQGVSAQPRLQSNEPVYRSGNWFVVRTTKTNSDAVACTGFYRAKGGIQLGADNLIIKVPGGLTELAFGWDDKSMGAARAASDTEKQVGAVVFAGADFDKLRRSKTLTLNVTTAQGSATHTLLLTGLRGALENIEAGCPVPAEPMARPGRAAPGGAREPGQAATRCPPGMLARMKANGIDQAQIDKVCQ